MSYIVTTGSEAFERQESAGRELAERYQLRFVARRDRSLARLHQEEAAEVVAVLTDRGLVIHRGSQRLPFATGLAELRIQRVQKGQHEPLVELMGLGPGVRVLDCTLGLARDALVMAASGAFVDGVESKPLLAAFLDAGLARLKGAGEECAQRVTVRWADYLQVLESAGEGTYDCVYLDPMFGEEVRQPTDFELFRSLADARPLEPRAVELARRVARRVVVIKDGPRARLLKSLPGPLRELTFGTRVRFGVIAAIGAAPRS